MARISKEHHIYTRLVRFMFRNEDTIAEPKIKALLVDLIILTIDKQELKTDLLLKLGVSDE